MIVEPASRVTEVALQAPNAIILMEQTRRIVLRRIADPDFGMSETAAALGMSVRTLQTDLRKAGTSLSELRQDIRRVLAIERVQTTNMKVAEIAVSLGYTSSSNFTRAFRAPAAQAAGQAS